MPSTLTSWDNTDEGPSTTIDTTPVKLPWQPVYWHDFLLTTMPLSAIELGLYTRLYGYYWQTGSLPLDVERCYRIAGAFSTEEQNAVRGLLGEFFYSDGRHFRHIALDAQLDTQRRLATLSSNKAREAAHKRWAKHKSDTYSTAINPDAATNSISEKMPGALLKQCQLKSDIKYIGEESPITPLVESATRPVVPEVTSVRDRLLPELSSAPREFSHPSVQLAITPALNPVKSSLSDAIQEVFAHWQTVMQHPHATLSRDRAGKIRARLREGYTVENLKQAIDGASQDAFLMGDNDRQTRYDDITTIFKNGGMVERLMEKHAFIPPGQHAGDAGHRGHRDGPQKRPDRFEHRQQQFERCVAKLQAAEQALAQQGFVDPLGATYRF